MFDKFCAIGNAIAKTLFIIAICLAVCNHNPYVLIADGFLLLFLILSDINEEIKKINK